MSLSLREQLLAAGLGTKKQAKKAEQQERQQRHKDKAAGAAEREREAQRARAAKAARDAELNRQRQIAAENKERAAQIKQLVEQHRLPKLETDEYFNFIHRGKVRRVCVDEALRARIVSGEVVLVRCEGKYEMVSADVAAKIRERNERAVVELPQETQPDENDPYKDFVVPDDLKW